MLRFSGPMLSGGGGVLSPGVALGGGDVFSKVEGAGGEVMIGAAAATGVPQHGGVIVIGSM